MLCRYDVVTAYISVTLASFLISYIAIFHQIHRAAEDGIESSKSTRGEWVPVTALTSYDHSMYVYVYVCVVDGLGTGWVAVVVGGWR